MFILEFVESFQSNLLLNPLLKAPVNYPFIPNNFISNTLPYQIYNPLLNHMHQVQQLQQLQHFNHLNQLNPSNDFNRSNVNNTNTNINSKSTSNCCCNCNHNN